jgi:hypothetical protein
MHTLLTPTHTHSQSPPSVPPRAPAPASAGPVWPEPFGAEHVAPGDEHDARLETLCVGESR